MLEYEIEDTFPSKEECRVLVRHRFESVACKACTIAVGNVHEMEIRKRRVVQRAGIKRPPTLTVGGNLLLLPRFVCARLAQSAMLVHHAPPFKKMTHDVFAAAVVAGR